MATRVAFDGQTHDLAALGTRAAELAAALERADARLRELEALLAVLTRARNAYIGDLRAEIVTHRSGVDLAALLDGE